MNIKTFMTNEEEGENLKKLHSKIYFHAEDSIGGQISNISVWPTGESFGMEGSWTDDDTNRFNDFIENSRGRFFTYYLTYSNSTAMGGSKDGSELITLSYRFSDESDITGYRFSAFNPADNNYQKILIYFDNYYTNWVLEKSEIILNEEPCIMEGTPMNMADGSEKLIEDIRSGDIILSYDPATETNVPAVVIDCYITGYNRGFDTYHFSDGRWLTLYDLHQIYSKGIGSVKDVRKITRNDQIVNIDGEIVRWTGTSKIYYQGKKKRRYNIITSNNLYYANGILLGHKPFSKLHRVLDSKGKVTASNEIRAIWQKDCDIYNQHNEFLNTKEFNAELAECNRQYASSKHIIDVCKKRLANSDYKGQKFLEGLLDEIEWNDSKNKRSQWREEINQHEVILKDIEKARRDIINKYRGNITEKSMFEECCERDNAIFEEVKKYFTKK